MTLNLAVKITADAAQATASVREFRSEVGRVGATGSAAAAGARTTATAIDEIGRRAGATVTSIAAVRAEVDKLSRQSLDRTLGVRTDFGSAARAADIADYGRQLDGLRAKFNPVWAAGQQYKKTLEEIAQAERVGAITTAEAIAAREKARVATGAQVAALRGQVGAVTGGTAKLADWQKQQIGFQLNDVATGLFSGQSPVTIAAQQGPQIAQLLGGWRSSFSLLASAINPVTVGIAGVTAAFIVGAKAATDYAGAVRATDTAAAGLGRNLGLTGSDIRQLAERNAAAGEISVAAARDLAVTYASTGKIAGPVIGDLIRQTKDFAATTQQDVPTATRALADAFADPARGAETLSQTYGLVDSATERLVRRLTEQGRRTEAQTVLSRALDQTLIRSGETVAWYTAAWDRLTRSISNYADATGKALNPASQPKTTQLSDLQNQVRIAEAAVAAAAAVPGYNPLSSDLQKRAEEAKKQIAVLKQQIAAEKDLADARRRRAEEDAAGRLGLGIADRSPTDEVRSVLSRQQLGSDTTALSAAQTARNLTADEQTRIAAALDAKTRALQTWIPEQQRAIELDRLDQAIAEARDPITRADLEARRQAVAIAGQEITSATARQQVEEARRRSLEQSLGMSRQQTADMREEAVIRGYLNDDVSAGTKSAADAGRQLQLELAIRPLVYAALKAEGDERRRLLAAIGEQTAAYKSLQSETQRAAAQQQIQSQRDGLEQTRLEIALIGQSEAVRNRATAALQAEQRIRDLGIAKYGQEANELRRLAQAQAEATTTLARQQDAWRTVSGSIGGAIDTTTDAIARGKDLGQTFEGIAQDITASMLKLAVANPLKNAILGENNATIADAGGILGRLFGGGAAAAPSPIASTLGTATITAGTVIVNGGVAGLGGGLFGSTTGSGVASAWDASGLPKTGAAFRATAGAMDPNAVRSMFAQIATDQGLVGFVPSDGGKYGIKTGSANEWANLFTGLSAHESGLRNSTVGDLGQFAGGSRGLLQLSYQDGLNWGFGRPFTAAELADPQFNGTAGVGIAKRLMMQSGSIEGGMGRYWGPISNEGWTPGNGRDAGLPWQSWTQDTSRVTGELDRFASSTGSATSGLNLFGSANDNALKSVTGLSTGFNSAAQSVVGQAGNATGTIGGAIGQIVTGIGGIVRSIGTGLGSIFSALFGGGGPVGDFVAGGLYADGGRITGPGTGTSDSIPIWASNGEYMVKATAAAKHLPLLEAINNDRLPRFATGGMIGAPIIDASSYRSARPAAQGAPAGGMTVVVNNNSSAKVQVREQDDGRGGRRAEIQLEDMVAAAIQRPGSRARSALSEGYGLTQKMVRR